MAAETVELFAHASLPTKGTDVNEVEIEEWEDDIDDLCRKIDFEQLKKDIEDHFDVERKKLLGDLDMNDRQLRMIKEEEIVTAVSEEMKKNPISRINEQFEREQRMYDDVAKEIKQKMKEIEWSNSVNAILCPDVIDDDKRTKDDSNVCSSELVDFFDWILEHQDFNYSIAKKSLRHYLIPLCKKHDISYLGDLMFRSCQDVELRDLPDLIFEIVGDNLLDLFPDMDVKEITKTYSRYLPSVRLMSNYLRLLQPLRGRISRE
jgi:hypothetical protein